MRRRAAVHVGVIPAAAARQLFVPHGPSTSGESLRAAGNPGAQQQQLTAGEVRAWKSITSTSISRDGRWLAYILSPQEGDSRTIFRRVSDSTELAFDSGDTPGTTIRFSHDGRWAIFNAAPPRAERERLQQEQRGGETSTVLVDLESGGTRRFERVIGFAFNGIRSSWVALHVHGLEAPGAPAVARESATLARTDRRGSGSDLILLELASGRALNLGNVSQFKFDSAGSRLYYVVDADDHGGNGVVARDMTTGAERVLESGPAIYRNLTWSESDGGTVLVTRVVPGTSATDSSTAFVLMTNVSRGAPRKLVYEPSADARFPRGMAVNTGAAPALTRDGGGIYFFVQPVGGAGAAGAAGLAMPGGGEARSGGARGAADAGSSASAPGSRPSVVIWHYQDPSLQRQQEIEAASEAGANVLMLYWIGQRRLIQLGDSTMRGVAVAPNDRWAIASDHSGYELEASLSGRRYEDHYVVDLRTGERRLALQRMHGAVTLSPDGQRFNFYSDGHYYVYEMSSGATRNITENVPTSFVDDEDDRNGLKPPRPVLGWAADSKSVLISDGWDVWNVPVSGRGAVNLTVTGSADSVRFSGPLFQPDNMDGIDLRRPLLFSALWEWSKKEAIARVDPRRPGAAMLLSGDADITAMKADDAEVYFYSAQTSTTFPDLYATDSSFGGGKRITDANPQQHNFAWSSGARLVDYSSTRGKRLQGVLHLPADYQEGRSYPTVVQIYEKLSHSLHTYRAPDLTESLNIALYTSRGYAVFRPDITYEINEPGMSALWSVVPAVEAAIATGVVDRDRIAMHGHSWGGYQAVFLATRTGIFRAVSAAAPITDLVSVYSSVYRRTGAMNSAIFETQLGRFSGGFLEHREAFLRNSPLFHADSIETPLLLMHNEDDAAVEFGQSIQLYNTLRKLGRPVVLLQYVGEGHDLSSPANQRDYAERLREFFDHYLRGHEPPDWWARGVPRSMLEEHRMERSRLLVPPAVIPP